MHRSRLGFLSCVAFEGPRQSYLAYIVRAGQTLIAIGRLTFINGSTALLLPRLQYWLINKHYDGSCRFVFCFILLYYKI